MSDPLEEIRQREERDRLPFIAPQEFWTDYEVLPDGGRKEVDWVRWVKKGTSNPSTVEEKISRISKGNTPVWQVLEPFYKRWKEGQASPVDGIPLAAWPGATPQLVKALADLNIKTVEDLARMEDSAIMKVSIPSLRDKQKNARSFLEAQKSTAGVAAENAKLKETVENQALRIAELQEAVKALADKRGITLVEEPKRRGRPPKQKEIAA